MFLLNKALLYIDAAERNVVAAHRSLEPVVIAPEGYNKQLCDAYLCVIRENRESERVYAALYLTVRKETLVYTPDTALPSASTPECIRQALCFLEAMGFRMESCNLGGSAALREVIIRSITVLHSPPAKSMKSSAKVPKETKLSLSEQNTAFQDPDEPLTEPVAAVNTEREQPVPDHAENSRALATELARLQEELERVGDERHALEEKASSRIAALESDLAAANAELAQFAVARDKAAEAFPPGEDPEANNELALLQDEYEALRTEYIMINNELTDRNTDLQQLAAELATLRTELERLSTALAGNPSLPVGDETSADAGLSAVNAELQKLILEKKAAEEAAAEEIAELKATIVRLAVTAHEAPHPAPDRAAPTAAQTIPANRNHAARDPAIRELAALFTQTDTEAAPAKSEVTFAKKGPTSFHLDNSLAAIPCVSADDIIELHVSFNTIEMHCGGVKPQNCSAYICGLERNGSKQIYVALYQIKTHMARIYVPAQQPQDPDDYGRIMQDAVSFVDVSGFIINLESLGGRPEDRLKVLQKIPVLDRL